MDRNNKYNSSENQSNHTPENHQENKPQDNRYTEEMKDYFGTLSSEAHKSSGAGPTEIPIQEVREVKEVEDVTSKAAGQPQQTTPPPHTSYTQSPNHTSPQYPPYPGQRQPQPPQQNQPKKPKKKRTGLKVFAVILAIVLSLGVGSGVTYYALRDYLAANPPASSAIEDPAGENIPEETPGLGGEESTPDSLPSTSDPKDNEDDGLLHSSDAISPHSVISTVAQKVLPQVVEVMTESVTVHPYFGELITSGAGSGVIISEDGYIITNNHVVEDAQNIKITTHEGEEYTAELIGRDEETDLAVLKIDGENLPTATFGDSDQLVVGDLAIVVGNPLGTLGGTVTDGIISALNREITIENQTMTLIQTSAAVNQGNSGGGLFDGNGNLVGVVNAKSSGTGIEGLGFAIPSNLAKKVAKQIIDIGYVGGRPQLGISVLEAFDQTTLRRFQLTEPGVYVMEVTRDIDLKPWDRIISIDGEDIESFEDIQKILLAKTAGESLLMEIERNNKIKEVDIALGEKLPDHIRTPQTTNTSA